MAAKKKTIQINLLFKNAFKKAPFDGIVKLVEKFSKEMMGNIYTYDIFVDLYKTYRAERKEEPEKRALINLTHAFFEFLNYLHSNREVAYYDKKMTEIVIFHKPSIKPSNEQ